MTCEQIQDRLSDFLDEGDTEIPRAEIARHLESCPGCAEHLAELKLIVAMLRDRKAPEAPGELMAKIHDRLAAEHAPTTAEDRGVFNRIAHWVNWPSIAAGAVAAGLLIALGTVVLKAQAPVPTIQTAAVTVATPTNVNLGFDVNRDVDNVTYTIDLPKGLQFLDANNQPVDAQSISWQGSLKRGKTVVPITVRGVQPGRYEILATVRKNQFAKATKIIVPIENGKQGAVTSLQLSMSHPSQEA